IWSFGVVLWEMLTGQRLFHGETTSHTLADVLRGEIDFNKLPRETPAKIRDLLRRCLDRNVKNRLRDIGEARVLLEGGLGPTERPISGRRFVLAWAAAALILALAVAALAFVHFRETTAEPEIARFQILPPENQTFVGPVSVSPDGRRIAYITNDAGRRRLWVRAIDALDAQAIADVDAVFPFWSPDNRFIAYGAQGKLRKSSVSGGPPFIICDLASVAAGGWNRDGVILIDDIGGIKRVSADGGVPSPVTALDAKRFETWHRNPTFLPDGRHFIFLRSSSHPDYSGIYVSSLEDKPEAPGRRLVATRSAGTFVPSEHPGIGFLLFLRNTTLMAQRFDYRRMEMIGEATPIVEGVGIVNILPVAMFSASTNVVAYRTNSDKTQLAWYTRDGKVLDTAGEPDRYADLALSPDGTREAFDRTDPGTLKRDLWIFDLSRRVSTRLTFHPGLDSHPVWSPDSEHIAFHSIRDGPGNLYQKAANGAGEEELLFKSNEDKVPDDWSSDGRFLMYAVSVSQVQIFVLPLAGDRHPVLYLANQFANGQGKFSPDHRWVAYRSNESGENEVYVQSFPANSATGGKWKVSSGGGLEPRWRKDGKELFYRSGRKLMAVDVATTPTFKLGVPKVLFEAPFWPGGGTASRHYAVTADGQKFLINAVPEAQGSSPITVVMNWTTALNK
ncbi:MAG: protein kinase, partial [Bryobacteraceae bacterium]